MIPIVDLKRQYKQTGAEIEKAVVDGYKKVEDSVVGGYKKIEDKFVDTFLKKDGETIEEAKARVKEEQEQLEEKNRARVEETLKKSKDINDINNYKNSSGNYKFYSASCWRAFIFFQFK